MENKKSNQTTTFLMIVGIIFIVVAGTIFVSSTWGYLPDPVKFVILLAVGTGLHAGASQLRSKNTLKKTETAMYYLGSAFFTFALYMVCKNVTVASIAALLPVGIRFVKEHKTFDFVMTALLADWIVLWFQLQSDFGVVGLCTVSSIVLCIYTLLDVYRSRWLDENKHVETAFTVFYFLHIVGYAMRSLVVFLIGSIIAGTELEYVATLVVMAAFIVVILTIQYMNRKKTEIRVFQSLSIFWLVIVGVMFVDEFVITTMTYDVVFLLTFAICALIMAVMLRKEMYYIVLGTGLFIPVMKLIDYTEYHSQDVSLITYSLLTLSFVGSIAVYYYRKEKQWEPEITLFNAVAAGMTQMFVYGIVMGSQNLSDYDFLGWSILAAQMFTLNFLIENKVAKKVFQSLALLNIEIASWCAIDYYVADNYQVVAGCASLAFAVYFIGRIINSKNEVVQWIQYAFACAIAMVLLMNALIDGGVEHALILGVCGVITLVIGSVQNSKRYVILSSIVLVLLVFYLTRHIWASIAWWVYLFVAGVILVAFAVKKESAERESSESEMTEAN